MTHRFTCRGFEGTVRETSGMVGRIYWEVEVVVGGTKFRALDQSLHAAKSRVRRKLDAVERALRERGKRC